MIAWAAMLHSCTVLQAVSVVSLLLSHHLGKESQQFLRSYVTGFNVAPIDRPLTLYESMTGGDNEIHRP